MNTSEQAFELKLSNARELFINGKYQECQRLLNDLLLYNNQIPEIFQMLATISYDVGKFNKAIKFFKRALELDPAYTDASVGLSIIYNDLGRYEEGKKEFETAKKIFSEQKKSTDHFVNELLAKKHEELADMYFGYKRYEEALDNLLRSKHLKYTSDIVIKIVESYLKLDNARSAVMELRDLIKRSPHVLTARQKLAEIYYDSGRILDAIETWESILLRDPENIQAKRSLKLATSSTKNNRIMEGTL